MSASDICDPRGVFSQFPDFFKTICDSMKIGILITDHQGAILYLNAAYAGFLKIDRKETLGKQIRDVVATTRIPLVAKTGQEEINFPHEFNGQSILVHRVPIFAKNRIVAVLALVLFTSAETVNKLAEKLSVLQSKIKLFEKELGSDYSTRYTLEHIISESSQMQRVKDEAVKAIANQMPVLITGESGTGKELIAQAIHDGSPRNFYPFVRVNCAAIPRELFESELFGYEKGSFTGAHSKGKPGKFELAHMGTIFLDEIGDLPLELQPKLLRVLEQREFERVGGNRLIRSDFRVIAATNRNLAKMVEAGTFRLDLFYRLNVVPISIPPLRDRREDILAMSYDYLEKSLRFIDNRRQKITIDEEAAAALENYEWPGNSRELLNVMERMLAYVEGDVIRLSDLPPYIQDFKRDRTSYRHASLAHYLEEAERKAIREVLAECAWNKSLAARKLGIHRTLLYKKMKKLGIVPGPP